MEGKRIMKKIINLILAISMLATLGITVFAADTETVGGQITLTQFLGCDLANTKNITMQTDVQNAVTVDKNTFFTLADSIILTSSLNPQTIKMNGIYITAEKNDGTFVYAYFSEDGGADKYSLSMSRLPYGLYTANDLSQISKLTALTQTKGISDWAKASIDKAIAEQWLSSGDFGGNYMQNITRERFCDVAFASLLKHGYKPDSKDISPFSDVSSSTVSALFNAKIINGKTYTVFAPNDNITREEAATILYRMAKYMKLSMPDVSNDIHYSDESSISDWAVISVKALNAIGVMKGVQDNNFAPSDTYTVEQAITTMVRLYEYK